MSVVKLCQLFHVSQSGYYAWKQRTQKSPTKDNSLLTLHVKAAFSASRGTYGSPRITAELKAQGFQVGRYRVMQIMRANGLKVRPKKRFVKTTDSSHKCPVAPNRLDQNFKAYRKDQKWASDITYIWTQEGWLYLAIILDLFSRRIVGWSVSDKLNTELPLSALQRAITMRRPEKGLIHHSDRGVQYCSGKYQKLLYKHDILCSMSRKGNCYDNAPAETFFKTLKSDLVWKTSFASRAQAKREVEKYIDQFYNTKRRHSALKYNSPIQYENMAINY